MTQDATDIVRLIGDILKSAASASAIRQNADFWTLTTVGNALLYWASEMDQLKAAIVRAEADYPGLMLYSAEPTRIVQIAIPPAVRNWANPQPGTLPSAAEERAARLYIQRMISAEIPALFVPQGGVGMVTCQQCGRSDRHTCNNEAAK